MEISIQIVRNTSNAFSSIENTPLPYIYFADIFYPKQLTVSAFNNVGKIPKVQESSKHINFIKLSELLQEICFIIITFFSWANVQSEHLAGLDKSVTEVIEELKYLSNI